MQECPNNWRLKSEVNDEKLQRFFSAHGLINRVKFPTHTSITSLDPVIPDLYSSAAVGMSDHYAIIPSISMSAKRDEPIKRTL